MGLDQYASKINKDGERIEIAYWRKHNRLQGWMENLYIQKGGTEEFNCVDVELELTDIIQLEEDINTRSLPETGGFFFGTDSYYQGLDIKDPNNFNGNGMYEDLQNDLKFITLAKDLLNSGTKVVYSSWW